MNATFNECVCEAGFFPLKLTLVHLDTSCCVLGAFVKSLPSLGYALMLATSHKLIVLSIHTPGERPFFPSPSLQCFVPTAACLLGKCKGHLSLDNCGQEAKSWWDYLHARNNWWKKEKSSHSMILVTSCHAMVFHLATARLLSSSFSSHTERAHLLLFIEWLKE